MSVTVKSVVSDSSTERISPSPRFFSRHSHRFVICILLLVANYFSQANSLGMSTAIVCMVNSTYVHGNIGEDESKHQTCPIKHDESEKEEFAIPGSLDWSPSQQSLLLSFRFYGSLATVAFAGIICDTLGPDRVLTGVLLSLSALTLIVPFLSHENYYILLVSRLFMGATESIHVPAVSCIAARWFPHAEKTIASSIFTTGYQFAGGFSSLFAASLCRSSFFGGWPSIFYVFGLTCCCFTVVWIIFGSQGPAKNRWVKESERKYLADNITIKNKGKRLTALSRILRSTAVHSVLFCNFSFAFTASILQNFLPLFLRDLGLPIDTIGLYMIAPSLSQIVGKLIIGPLIDFCTGRDFISLPRATKLAQSMGSIGSTVALMLLSVIPSCSNPTAALYLLIAYGLIYSSSATGVYTSALSISPANMATISTLQSMSRMIGSATSNSIINALTVMDVSYKWSLIFASASVFQCIGGVHFLFFGTTEEQSF